MLTTPPITLPTNMISLFPADTVCIIDPTMKATAPIARASRRPNLSPTGAAAKAPKKQPACRSDTMFAEKAF